MADDGSLELPPRTYLGRPGEPRHLESVSVLESRYHRGEHLPRHSHEAAHFCLVLAGSYSERVFRREWNRAPMSLAWYPADVDHAEQHECDGRHFLIEAYEPAVQDAGLTGGPRCFADGPIARQAMRAWVQHLLGDELELEDATFTLLGMVAEDRLSRSAPPRWLADVDEMLAAEFMGAPRVARIANVVGVHPVHLARVFRRHRGESIAEAVRRMRVGAAVSRLANGSNSLAEIATAVGFADQSHMTRAFQTVIGATPGRVRAGVSGNDTRR